MEPTTGPIRQCTKPGCRKLTRSARYKAAEYPGTLPRLGGGLCIICHHEANPLNCVECGHPMRISNLPVRYAPGTRMRSRDGMCDNCTYVPKNPLPKEPEISPERVEHTKRGLESFLVRRRDRMERYAA